MGIFKLTLFHSSKKLQSENKQNKMEVEIGLTAGLEAWGFDTYQKEFANPQKEPGGAQERSERDVRAKTVLNPDRYSHLRPLLPRKKQNDPAC